MSSSWGLLKMCCVGACKEDDRAKGTRKRGRAAGRRMAADHNGIDILIARVTWVLN